MCRARDPRAEPQNYLAHPPAGACVFDAIDIVVRGLILTTIAPPPKPAIFFNGRFVAARYDEGCYEKNILKHFLVCKGLSNDDVGVARGIVFQEIRPGAGCKTGDFVKEKLEGLELRATRRNCQTISLGRSKPKHAPQPRGSFSRPRILPLSDRSCSSTDRRVVAQHFFRNVLFYQHVSVCFPFLRTNHLDYP